MFVNGCVKYGNYNIPVLPLNVNLTDLNKANNLRQWIYTVYAHYKFHCKTENITLYQFLIDMLRVTLSDVGASVKATYKSLAMLLLQAQRSNTITEYEFLKTNKPMQVYGGEKEFQRLMLKCMKMNNIRGVTINTLWTAIMIALDDETLITFHKSAHMSREILNRNRGHFNVQDNHDILRYVKICMRRTFTESSLMPIRTDLINSAFVYHDRETINVPQNIILDVNETEIYPIDDLQFATKPYEFDRPTVDSVLNTKCITITNSHNFKSMLDYRYPFLQELDYTNLVLAGGACRSILLNQKVNDFDFLFTGLIQMNNT